MGFKIDVSFLIKKGKGRLINLMGAALFGSLLLLSGCSKKETASSQNIERSGLPSDLIKMQGHWVSSTERNPIKVIIEGYTVRLAYGRESDGVRCKRNVSIREVVSSRGQLEVYGDNRPWFYLIHQEDGGLELDLRFFDSIQHEWINSHLRLETPADQVVRF